MNKHLASGSRSGAIALLLAASAAPVAAQSWVHNQYGGGANNTVHDLLVGPPGDIIAVGAFTQTWGQPVAGIGSFQNISWSQVGAQTTVPPIRVAFRMANGDLVVGEESGFVRRFNGSVWITQAQQFNAPVTALSELPGGVLVAGGAFTSPVVGVARLNGGSWGPLGAGLASVGEINDLVSSGPNLLAAGSFVINGGGAQNVAQFNGSSWSATAFASPPTGTVDSLAVMRNGDLLAADRFSGSTTRILRTNGTAWQPVATNIDNRVFELLEMPSGDLLAAGQFTIVDGIAAPSIARFDANAATWSALANSVNGAIRALAIKNENRVVVGGDFTMINGTVATRIVDLRAQTAGSWTQILPACIGSGGVNRLIGLNSPMIGGTFRSRATGMAANSIALEIRGLQQLTPTPLNNLIPEGDPNCSLLVSPDLLIALPAPVNGVVDLTIDIPPSIAFLGANLFQQVANFDFATSPFIVTSTNAINLLIGEL